MLSIYSNLQTHTGVLPVTIEGSVILSFIRLTVMQRSILIVVRVSRTTDCKKIEITYFWYILKKKESFYFCIPTLCTVHSFSHPCSTSARQFPGRVTVAASHRDVILLSLHPSKMWGDRICTSNH